MVSPPPGSVAGPALKEHFKRIAADLTIPIVVQDHPTSSGVRMPVEFIASLYELLPPDSVCKLEDPPTAVKMNKLRELEPGYQIFGGLGGVSLLHELDAGSAGAMTGFAAVESLDLASIGTLMDYLVAGGCKGALVLGVLGEADRLSDYERDQVRNEARHPAREVNGLVGRAAADMDVLTEHGELLGQVAVQLGQRGKAFGGEDSALRPVVKWMRTAARDADIELVRRCAQLAANLGEIAQQRVMARVHFAVHLDHALGDLGLDVARTRAPGKRAKQAFGAPRQIEVAQVDELQFQLDAHGQRFTGSECGQHGHPFRV